MAGTKVQNRITDPYTEGSMLLVSERGRKGSGETMDAGNDRREGLKEGSCLPVGGGKQLRVGREIGRGAVCIVYDGIYVDRLGIQHKVRIRECCPDGLRLKRDGEGVLTASLDDQSRFEEEKQHFRENYRRNVQIRNQPGLVNSTVNASDLIERNQTCYAVMAFDEGTDYQIWQDPSLKGLFKHIRSLAELIGRYHENGCLHLDIKPENVLVIPETEEHVLLFDFDSVMTMEELKDNIVVRLPYSRGFSAPEQMQGRRERIGCHTDIYSIGALVFYKVFGRRPGLEDGRLSAQYDFSCMRYADRRYQPKLYRKMTEFFQKCLSVSTVSRWKHMDPVLESLDELIRLSDVDQSFVYDSFQYNSGCFIGRAEELRKIHEGLQDHQSIFLSGLGGIGKTEIARKYAQIYRQDYGTVVYTIYESSLEELVNQDILVNGMEQEEEESSRDYFERKLQVLKESLASDDLIIIDNFDVDQDEDLEALFTCPCKFIITTREDFRDYDYSQLDIDRMESMDEVMQLFEAYNTFDYTDSERAAIRQILSLVDGHTMTVELIAKYLRDTRENPEELYQRFLEKEGIANTEGIRIKQRKDRRLRAESVNNHIRILFDVSRFSPVEEELIRSLSLLGSIRITRRKFRELCKIGDDTKELELLIRRGWIEYNEATDKIALHQIIQDLVYQDLRPDAENCTNLVESMLQFWKADVANDSERQVRDRVFAVFMERLTGHNLLYAELCTEYGKTNYLKKAEEICRKSPDRKAMELLQEIYRKKIKDAAKCEDMFETELDLNEYYRYKFREITELLDKTMEYCKGYSDSPDYLAKTCTAIGTELDELLMNEFMVTANNGRIEELDRLYQMIMDILDMATQNILLADFADLDKVELLTKIRDFYTDKDIMALYRCEYFLNVEKAHWYQERIDGFRNPVEEDEAGQTICIDMDSMNMTNRDAAYIYEGKEDYDNAIRYYEKAYKDPDELGILILYDLARVCEKAGYVEQAKEHLWHILVLSKEEDGYSNDACVGLVRILVSEGRLEEAEGLAQEMLSCNSSWMQEDDCVDAVRGMTEACYWLFAVEEDPQRKEGFWEKAVTYYRMLDPGESLTDDLREFVIEYTGSMEISEGWFREVQELLKRIDRYQGRRLLHNIYEQVFLICRQDDSYGEWYIHFLLMYADYLNDLENQQYTEAFRYCEMAQQYYDLHHMKDAYIQNQIYHILVECMNNIKEYDFEQVQKVREKCDYALLAQRKIESNSYSDKEQYEVWKQAADKYDLVDCFERKQYCLQKAMDVLMPAFNQWGNNRYDDYWSLASGMIRCHICLENRNQAYIWIKKTYERLLDYHKILKKEGIWSWNWWTGGLADDLDDLGFAEEALYMYLYILYLSISNGPDYCLVRNLCPDEQSEMLFYEQLETAVKGELDNEAINQTVALKKKLLSLLEPWESRRKYAELLQWFSRHYEHHEIEFKRG